MIGRRVMGVPPRDGGHVLEGPASIAAADEVRKLADQKSQWPYNYLFPPPHAIRVTAGADASGTLVVPIAATPAEGLVYTVDEGFMFALEKLVVIYANAVALPGDFDWSLTLNSPLGTADLQGNTIQGFTNVDVPLGTLQIPWPLECPEIFSPNDRVAVTFTNTNLASGAGNFFKAIFLGWRWPVR